MKITEITQDSVAGLTEEQIATAVSEGETRIDEILNDDNASLEDLAEVTSIETGIALVTTHLESVAAAEQARVDDLAAKRAARDARRETPEETAEVAEPEEPQNPETDEVVEEPEAVVETVETAPEVVVEDTTPEVAVETAPEQPAAVAASASTTLAGRRPAVTPPKKESTVDKQLPVLVASAGNGLVEVGQAVDMATFQQIAQSQFGAAAGSQGRHVGRVGQIKLQSDPRLVIGKKSTQDEQNAALAYAADIGRVRATKEVAAEVTDADALVAAGWCAPSETIYDLCEGGSREGLWETPELVIERGGLNYTQGLDFSVLYTSDFGWDITEAEMDAGTFTKDCVSVPCPDFEDKRLNALGFCVTSDLLPKAAYPELEVQFINEATIAFDHKKANKQFAAALATAGTAIVAPNLGSVATSTLTAVELVAEGQRRAYRWTQNQVLEVVVPHWAKAAFRADLANRNGVYELAVSDSEIAAWFSARNLNVQYVYDYPGFLLAAGVATMPTSMQAFIYKAGTFVSGVAPVISLSTVYDSVLLAENKNLAMFYEQGLMLLNRCHGAKRITIPVCAVGRTGAADVTCA